jgi:excisionase family DNA binding protein
MDELVLYTASEVAELLRLNPQVVQRKLQAGEIPGYRIGKEWRVERARLLAWLEEHSNQRADAEARLVERYFDRDGALRSLPAQRGRREAVLRRLVAEIDPARSYRERELNGILRRFHPDVATIRREMVASKLLVRTADGVYKRAGPREPALRRG